MKKIGFIFSVILIVVTCLFLIYQNESTDEEENIFSIKTSYSYINQNGVDFTIKLYSNKDESLLSYAKNAEVYLHDKKEENMILCSVRNSYLNNTILFEEKYYYEYIYDLNVNITSLAINECYLKVKFTNKEYDFMIGSFDIIQQEINDNIISISDLYGLTNDDVSKSLCAIVLTLNNPTKNLVKINSVSIGSNYKVFINKENITDCMESNDIYDYLPNYSQKKEETNTGISIEKESKITIVLPIKYIKDYYLHNTYLLFEIGNSYYYYPNFTYIDSTDISVMKNYVVWGCFYDI